MENFLGTLISPILMGLGFFVIAMLYCFVVQPWLRKKRPRTLDKLQESASRFDKKKQNKDEE